MAEKAHQYGRRRQTGSKKAIRETALYCKRLNFREDLIFANFPNLANCLQFAKNRSHEQFVQYVNTTEPAFDSRKLEPANNLTFSFGPIRENLMSSWAPGTGSRSANRVTRSLSCPAQ
ncbi:MAG: hypothetical protein PV344_06405, partial [Anaplasma sp.]|nr:hypothetical protein [Anaplasma sp.]